MVFWMLESFGGLAVGEVLGVLPQRAAGAFEVLGDRDLAAPARVVSDLAADLVQCVAGERHDVRRVYGTDRVGESLGDRRPRCRPPCRRTNLICTQGSSPEVAAVAARRAECGEDVCQLVCELAAKASGGAAALAEGDEVPRRWVPRRRRRRSGRTRTRRRMTGFRTS